MKMKITTAEEKFNYAIWHILDMLKKDMLTCPEKNTVTYLVNINIEHQVKFIFGMEYDAIKFLKRNKVIEEVEEPDICEIEKPGNSEYNVYKNYHFKILSKFNDYYCKYTNIIKGGRDVTQLFGFRNKTFWLKLISGDEATINFSPKENRKHPTQPYYLLYAFVNAIQNGNWKSKGSWIETALSKQSIIDEIKRIHYPTIDELNSHWLSNVRNNLVNKSIPANLQKLIKISPYDRKLNTYTFSIKIPT